MITLDQARSNDVFYSKGLRGEVQKWYKCELTEYPIGFRVSLRCATGVSLRRGASRTSIYHGEHCSNADLFFVTPGEMK